MSCLLQSFKTVDGNIELGTVSQPRYLIRARYVRYVLFRGTALMYLHLHEYLASRQIRPGFWCCVSHWDYHRDLFIECGCFWMVDDTLISLGGLRTLEPPRVRTNSDFGRLICRKDKRTKFGLIWLGCLEVRMFVSYSGCKSRWTRFEGW